MNIAVLVKWVPEPQGTPTLGPDHLLVREGADGALDPGDEYGLERALQLVERDGGEVTLVSMGPEVAVAAVQRGLAMGAHRAVLVTDDALRGADTLVTARVLAAALRPIGADLVVAAVESTDGYTGTLPITVAELLGLPSVTFATSIDVDGAHLRAERVALIGWSGLGMEMAVYAIRYPTRVSRIVQIGAVPPAASIMREAGGDTRGTRTDTAALNALDRRAEAGAFKDTPREYCTRRDRLTRRSVPDDGRRPLVADADRPDGSVRGERGPRALERRGGVGRRIELHETRHRRVRQRRAPLLVGHRRVGVHDGRAHAARPDVDHQDAHPSPVRPSTCRR